MMELKVWVEGIQRIVCGVTDTTTCQDVVYALAHATGKTGRFTLIERWRNSERLLAPHEHPLKILLKWGEYASDVQFILQRTALEPRSEVKPDKVTHSQQFYGRSGITANTAGLQSHCVTQKTPVSTVEANLGKAAPNSPPQNRDIKKSLTFSGGHSSHLCAQVNHEVPNSSAEVGAMQGFLAHSLSPPHQYPTPTFSDQVSCGSSVPSLSARHHHQNPVSRLAHNLVRPPAPPPYELVRGNPPPPPASFRSQPHNSHGTYSSKERCSPSMFVRPPPPYPVKLTPNSSGPRPPRELPPYRDPPPPPPPSHPALMKISPQGKLKNQGPLSLDPDKSSTLYNTGNESFTRIHIAHHPESSPNNDGNELSFNASRDQWPHKNLPYEEDIKSNNSYGSSDKVKVDKMVNQEATSISSVINHANNSPGKVVGQSSNSSTYKNTSPVKMSSALNSNSETVSNSVPGDINDNMLCSVSGSIDKNTKNHLRDSPVSNIIQRSSPLKGVDGERSYVKDMIKQLVKDSNKEQSSQAIFDHKSEQVVVDNYYRELVRLVNKQREKISAQQIDLTKYEAEIAFTEGYCKEEESRLNYIKSEIQRLENVPDELPDSPVNKLSIEELELSLKEAHASEALAIEDVTTIKKKISNYDQQLNQMMSKIRIIQDALEHEEQLQKQMQSDFSQGEEQGAILREIEKLQAAVNQATNQADHAQEVSLQLSQELSEADSRLLERRKEIDKLKVAMREANMEALTMTPAEELKALSENRTGIVKNGTSRRMKGSPRQLETAVPTSKNPHGVWV